jgi:hypothetical protein
MSDYSPPIPPRFPAYLLTNYRRQKVGRERDRYLVDAVQKMGRELNNLEGVDLELEDLDLLNADCLSDDDPEEVDSGDSVRGGDD